VPWRHVSLSLATSCLGELSFSWYFAECVCGNFIAVARIIITCATLASPAVRQVDNVFKLFTSCGAHVVIMRYDVMCSACSPGTPRCRRQWPNAHRTRNLKVPTSQVSQRFYFDLQRAFVASATLAAPNQRRCYPCGYECLPCCWQPCAAIVDLGGGDVDTTC
jgi:hypothetical protein